MANTYLPAQWWSLQPFPVTKSCVSQLAGWFTPTVLALGWMRFSTLLQRLGELGSVATSRVISCHGACGFVAGVTVESLGDIT